MLAGCARNGDSSNLQFYRATNFTDPTDFSYVNAILEVVFASRFSVAPLFGALLFEGGGFLLPFSVAALLMLLLKFGMWLWAVTVTLWLRTKSSHFLRILKIACQAVNAFPQSSLGCLMSALARYCVWELLRQ
mmetsp:Transcript_115081/g.223578  ORF Transcript_115081/g.223578 Transcript_115081/m.223578 type:complete len:133 (+) Transcript_115081:369-767(+)